MKDGKVQKPYNFDKLAERLRDAYLAECEAGECQCTNKDVHEGNLVLAREQKKKEAKEAKG